MTKGIYQCSIAQYSNDAQYTYFNLRKIDMPKCHITLLNTVLWALHTIQPFSFTVRNLHVGIATCPQKASESATY